MLTSRLMFMLMPMLMLGLVFRIIASDVTEIFPLPPYPDIAPRTTRNAMARPQSCVTHPCDGHGGLRHINPGRCFPKGIVLHEQPHQVSSGQELHHHVQVHLILRCISTRNREIPRLERTTDSCSVGRERESSRDQPLGSQAILDRYIPRTIPLCHMNGFSIGSEPTPNMPEIL